MLGLKKRQPNLRAASSQPISPGIDVGLEETSAEPARDNLGVAMPALNIGWPRVASALESWQDG